MRRHWRGSALDTSSVFYLNLLRFICITPSFLFNPDAPKTLFLHAMV